MRSLKKELAITTAVAASIFSGYAAGAAVQNKSNDCHPDSGYALSMQDAKAEKVLGVYYIKRLQAISLDSNNHIDTDQGHTIDAASMQLNTYLRGTLRDGKKEVYWVQDTVTFVYSKNGMKQYLSSEAYKFNATGSDELVMSAAKGKGSIFSDGSCTNSAESPAEKGMTYIYATRNMPIHMPQYGFLEMDEQLKNGRIDITIKYLGENYKKVDTYDTIVLGRSGEFTKAHFVSNKVLDTELGFGGDGCGSTAYFMKMKAYLGMYFYNKKSYIPVRYMHGNPSTEEESANLECRYTGGMEEFYRNKTLKNKELITAARVYDKVVLGQEHVK